MIKQIKYAPSSRWFWDILSYPVGAALFVWNWVVHHTSKIKIDGSSSTFSEPAIFVNWHQHYAYLIFHHGAKRDRWTLVSQAPIIPVGYICKKGRPNTSRWDQSLIPVPFDEITVKYGPLIYVDPEWTDEMALCEIKSGLINIQAIV